MKIHLTTNVKISQMDLLEFMALIPNATIDVKKTKSNLPIKFIEKFNDYHGDFDWIRSITPKGYDLRGFITSKQQLIDGGIKSHIGMYDNHDGDLTMDFYSGLSPILDKRAKKNGFRSNLAWQLAHEGGHGLAQMTGKPEIVNLVHDAEAKGELKDLIIKLHADYLKKVEKLKIQVFLLEKIVKIMTKLKQVFIKPTGLLPCVERGANAVIAIMKEKGHPVKIVQGFRSIEEQNKLYAQGRTTPGPIVTEAKGGQSYHNYGCAVDFVFINEGYNASNTLWQILGVVGKNQGFEWGGDWTGFVDRPHFEMKKGYTFLDFQSGKVDFNKFK